MLQQKTFKATDGWLRRPTQLFFCLTIALLPLMGNGFEVERRAGTPVENRFVVGPVKVELSVPLGGVSEAVIELENRTGRSETYQFSFEDFGEGENSDVVLLGDQNGERSLKEYLSVEDSHVTLLHGERVRVPVSVSIPAGETPGGKFGTLVISARSGDQSGNQSGSAIIGRVAVLFFVTVPGEITYDGSLQSFHLVKKPILFGSTEIPLRLVFENKGTAHVNPYGVITIRNMFGHVVSEQGVDPWFVLPESVRTRDLTSVSPKVFGWYSATLELNRGYGDVVDRAEVSFIVVSPGAVALFLCGVFAVVWSKKRRKKIS